MDKISVDENGYVWVGGLKICRLTTWGCIEFFDRDKKRAERRGSHFVYANSVQLLQAFANSRQAASNEQIQGKEEERSGSDPT